MNPREIETLLHDAAERVRVEPVVPAEVRRRIRMRRIGTVAISLSVVAGLVVGAVLATETWSRDPILPSQERDEHSIVVTREDPPLPEGCGVRRATEALLSFTDALSDGDLAALDGAFSREDIFRSVGIADPHGLTGDETVDRAALLAYLELRVARSESYRLTKAMVETAIGSPNPGGSGAVRVDFLATRTADDIDGTLEFRGWANLDCPAGDIYVMNLGPLHPREAIERWCPAAPPDTGDAVVACSREMGGRNAEEPSPSPTPSETPIDLEPHVIDDGVVTIRPKKVRPGDTITLSINDPPGYYGLDWYLYRKDGASEWTYIGGYSAGPPGQWQKHRQNRFFFLPEWRDVGIPSAALSGSDSVDLTVPPLEPGTYGIFGLFQNKKNARKRHIDLFEVI